MDLKSTRIQELEGIWSSSASGFQLLCNTKSFIVLCESFEEKEKWMTAIQGNITILIEDEGESTIAPIWTHDSFATKCALCSQEFSLLVRRHHCRKCGSICCSACSENERLLSNIDKNKPVRVCDTCENTFRDEEEFEFRCKIYFLVTYSNFYIYF